MSCIKLDINCKASKWQSFSNSRISAKKNVECCMCYDSWFVFRGKVCDSEYVAYWITILNTSSCWSLSVRPCSSGFQGTNEFLSCERDYISFTASMGNVENMTIIRLKVLKIYITSESRFKCTMSTYRVDIKKVVTLFQ